MTKAEAALVEAAVKWYAFPLNASLTRSVKAWRIFVGTVRRVVKERKAAVVGRKEDRDV
jgi:hypothetical protein